MRRSIVILGFLTLAPAIVSQAPNWSPLTPAASPGARWQHALSFDAGRDRIVVFGGRSSSNAILGDTWEFDGTTWAQLATTTQPANRQLSSMVYDQARGRTVLFGGLAGSTVGDTWLWNGATWTQAQPATSPPARYVAALAYDSDRKRVVLFGGSSYTNDTWEWDGSNWTQIITTNSPAGRRTKIAYDAGRKRMVLYGGETSNNVYNGETWEYDGVNWTQISPTTSPGIRVANGIAYDPVRQRIVLFGGFDQTFANLSDTWEYDGTNWTQLSPATSPSARRDFDHFAYDPIQQRVVMFGGYTNSGATAETWVFGSPPRLTASPGTISIARGGSQTLSLDAGSANANRFFWMFGSMTGVAPGVNVLGVQIPLNPDPYTDLVIGAGNSPVFSNFRNVLDQNGKATATLNVPASQPIPSGFKLHHAYILYNPANGQIQLASNPVQVSFN